MRRRWLIGTGAVVMTAALALSGCGSRNNGNNGGGGGGDTASSSSSASASSSASSTGGGGGGTKVLKIGVVAPLTGDLAPLGLGIRNSVMLAVSQANKAKTVPGYTLQVMAEDDQGQTDPAQNAGNALAADGEVAGVVGTLNSSTAQVVQPLLAKKNIAMISPANTNPSLTQGAKWQSSPKRPYDNYFRVCTTDAVQGPFAARYLYQKLGLRKVATVNDKKTYGQGLVLTFTEEFKKLGGTVTSAQTINPDDSNYSAVISTIKPTNPQALYYGGEFPQAGPLSQQMHNAGLNVPLMGGDGIYDPNYIKLGGSKSAGDLATSVGAPTAKLATAQAFVAAYKAGGYKEDYGAYGAYAYDAANALIKGIASGIGSSDVTSARPNIVSAVGKVSFSGVTGKVSFDQYGDSTTRILTVYKVENGSWSGVSTSDFK